jgi:predicted metal-dependent enzyme (double-stranded beta helix superfamily)
MFDTDDLIAECRRALMESEPRLAVKEVLERAMSSEQRVARALPAERAEVVPLYAAADLSILKVAWAPGMRFRPHNHLMWAAIALYGGQEDNTFYRRVGTGITISGGRRLQAGDVALLGDDTIHAVSNPRRTYTGAIHIYGGDITARPGRSEWEEASLEEVPYDFDRVRRTFEAANLGADQSA